MQQGQQLGQQREALDSCGAVSLDGQHSTGLYRLSVDEDGAGEADARFACHVRPGQAARLAQNWTSSIRGSSLLSCNVPLTRILTGMFTGGVDSFSSGLGS